jgi:hypothetical protein
MSAFNPRALFGASDQKRALLERLMQQYQQSASRASGLSAGASSATAGTGGTGMPVAFTRPFGGTGHLTGPPSSLHTDLLDRLGPGGWGRGIAGIEASAANGMPVQAQGASGSHGGFHGPPAPVGPPHPIPAQAFPIPTLQAAAGGNPAQAIASVSAASNPANLMPSSPGPMVDPRTGALRGYPGPVFRGGVRGSLY